MVNNQDRNSFVAPSIRIVQLSLLGGILSCVGFIVGVRRVFTEKGGW